MLNQVLVVSCVAAVVIVGVGLWMEWSKPKTERRLINHPDGSTIELIVEGRLIKSLKWSAKDETVYRGICFENEKWHMVEFDKETGEPLWHNVTIE